MAHGPRSCSGSTGRKRLCVEGIRESQWLARPNGRLQGPRPNSGALCRSPAQSTKRGSALSIHGRRRDKQPGLHGENHLLVGIGGIHACDSSVQWTRHLISAYACKADPISQVLQLLCASAVIRHPHLLEEHLNCVLLRSRIKGNTEVAFKLHLQT